MRYSIEAERLGKRFRKFSSHRPRTLQEAAVSGFRNLRHEDAFWALREVSFRVAAGEMLGIVGANGAGKSTLLRVVGGVIRLDEGALRKRGRVGALIDLGTGFHGDLTGRENVYVNGVISGLTRAEIRRRFDAIVAFAGLEAFIDSPLRTYSSGMQMRLAFSVAAHCEPEILLIDEILAVGDLDFQQKCLARIGEFQANGCATVLVSHNLEQVARLCDTALWLASGQIAAAGAAEETVRRYASAAHAETISRTPQREEIAATSAGVELRLNENRFGSQALQITSVYLRSPLGLPVVELEPGQGLHIVMDFLAHEAAPAPIFHLILYAPDGRSCYEATSEASAPLADLAPGAGRLTFEIDRLDLAGGAYSLDIGVYAANWSHAYDLHRRAYSFEVRSSPGVKGILNPPARWQA